MTKNREIAASDTHRSFPHDRRQENLRVVHLCSGPAVSRGTERRAVPRGSRRLLAFVALTGGRVARPHAAGVLWPELDEVRAAGNLRSALWRLRRAGADVIESDKWSMALADDVLVDVHLIGAWADRLRLGTPTPEDLSLSIPPSPMDALDLLPGWRDDWVIVERERTRQRVLHGLEALSRHLLVSGRRAEAIEVARSAVSAEPLRESAHRLLVEVQAA